MSFNQFHVISLIAPVQVPPDRFDPKTHCDPTGKKKNTSHTPYGCFIDEPGLFDPRFFNMSPREALQTCPMQRLSLVTAYEALEMSGYVPNRTPSTKLDRVGTFYGQTSDDWREINAAQDVDTYFITGGVRAFGPGRINYHFKFSGPSYSVDTACSSGMAAVQIACTSLWAGECDTAIAGGVSVMTNSDIFSGLSRGQFLSKVGPCQTFDNDADGYCRADGIGTVILKRLQDAEADKDNVLGVILGSATNHSADAISITHPHAETQERLYTKILNEAGVDALDIDYVEMHGTGTQAGDGTEMRSVTNVFAPRSRKRSSKQSLYLGAVKANVGHGEAASGVTALIKCLLILQKNSIPPHVGIKKMINQSFPKDLDERNVHIALKNTPWKSATEGTRRMYVSNFSAAGGNTGLLMEDGPRKVLGRLDPRTASIIAISAKSKSSLKRNLERLVSYIDVNPSVDLQSLAYTLTARRIHHNYRTAFAATDLTDARTGLALSLDSNITPISGSSPRVAFVFTGQGSHYPAIAKELFDEMSQFRLDLLSFDSICYSQGFPSFLPLIDGTITDVGSLPPTVTQLGLCCIQMALARLFRSWGVKPNVVMGHSLGEYAALNVAGVVSVSDTIYLVGKRAQCLQKACTIGTHTMLAVRAPKSTLSELPESLQAKIQVACINGPQATVYSGLVDDIKSAADHFESIGIKSTKLDVPYAFHSSQVDPILSSFEEIASSITYNKAEMTIVSPLWGNVIPAGASIDATYLRRHAREPVNFVGGLLTSQGAGYVDEKTAWVEIGPQPTCLGMVKSAFGPEITTAPSLRKGESAWKTLANCLSLLHTQGATIDWNEYHRDFVDSIHLLDLPKYAFDNKNYWIQYTNDWCLTKTDVPSARILQVEEKHHLSTTTVQEVVSESIVNGKATVVVESDLCRADLRAAVSGHLVNGAGLCPSSIYADMALTVADHMYKLLKPNKSNIDMNVCHMEVTKPLILKKSGTEKQILRLTATTDGDLKEASLTYSSGEGATRIEHAKCVVEYGDGAAWLNEWTRNAYLIKGRIDGLQKAAGDGKAHRILQGMAYKLFEALVQYSKPFRGMQEVIMDSDQLEATAHVKFQTTEADGNFFCSPFWIDSVAHLSGFIVNATDAMDSKNQVYVSHGWESMRIAKQLSASKSYRSYVRMQPTEGKMVAGDVYVFEGETIIAMVGGLKFQCIPRTVLDTLLPPAGGTRAAMVKQEQKATVTKSTSGASGQLVTTETQVTKTVTATRPTISVTATVLGILADEIGIDIDELADPHAFADLGVDSLMSLSISGRMREELELDVNSTLFNDYPTIGQLKGFLAKFESQTGFVDTPVSGISTPDLDSQTDTSEDDGPDSPPSGNSSMVNILPNSASSASMDLQVVETTLNKQVSSKEELIRDSISTRQATSVLLQGNSRKSSVNLFIFPDGGGSATSYVGIPDLSTKVAVYGLNSPFMKVPEEYDCGVRGITLMMLKEVRRRQPHGPYVFAGWSAGGVVAFEATQQMIAAGESVEKLILLDSPCPLIIEPLPPMLHQFFHQIGLLGDGLRHESKIPPWLLPHFAASVTALNQYRATKIDKIDPAKAPQTIAIWCTDGVCKNPDDPKPDPYPYGHAQWLLENRTDFGPNLWDTFIPNEKITTLTVPGNHFTMMRDPNVGVSLIVL